MRTRKFWTLSTALIFLASSGGFAQARNAVSVDIVPLAKGVIAFDTGAGISVFGISAEYERVLIPHYSVGVRVDFYGVGKDDDGLKTSGAYFGFAVQGRWYALSESLEKFFWGVGIGFNTLAAKDDGGTEIKALGMSGMTFTMKAGWKLFFVPKAPAFFVEPSIAYALAKSSLFTTVTPLGWQPGLNIGLVF
jgi:hypothetical protein